MRQPDPKPVAEQFTSLVNLPFGGRKVPLAQTVGQGIPPAAHQAINRIGIAKTDHHRIGASGRSTNAIYEGTVRAGSLAKAVRS